MENPIFTDSELYSILLSTKECKEIAIKEGNDSEVVAEMDDIINKIEVWCKHNAAKSNALSLLLFKDNA